MKHKFLSIALMLALILTTVIVPVTGAYALETDDGLYSYNRGWYSDGTEWVYLYQYNGDRDVEELVVPSEIDGKPVVQISGGMFEGLTNLKSVTLPESVVAFAGDVFSGCTSLEEINGFPLDGVEYRFGSADTFKDTPWYDKVLEEAGDGAVIFGTTVYDLSTAKGKVEIPEGTTSFATGALDNTCTYDDDGNIVSHSEITELSLPSTLDGIESTGIIAEFPKLKAINVADGNEEYYSKNGVLFDKHSLNYDGDDVESLEIYPAQKTGTSYTVPKSVGVIGFVRSQYLEKISFAGTGVTFSGGAFEGCSKLTTVNLTEGSVLTPQMFGGTNISTLTIPDDTTIYTNSAGTPFSGMSTLKTIKVSSDNDDYKVVNGALIRLDEDGNYDDLIVYPAARSGSTLVIPEGVDTVNSLEDTVNLKTIVVPKSVTYFPMVYSAAELGNITTIKYKGTKTEWAENVSFGNWRDSDYGADDFTMYYNAKAISGASISGVNSTYRYTGSAIKPAVTVKYNGTKLSSSQYSVSYKNNKATGKATITVTGTNSKYYGTKTKTFIITPKAPSSVTAKLYGYDDVKVSWKASTGADGYAVYYKKGSGSYTLYKRVTGTSVKVSNLSDGAKYTFKVVPYVTVDGTKYEGGSKVSSSVYTLKKPNTPTVVKSGSKVKISWNNISGETGYQISRSTSKSTKSVWKTVTSTTAKNATYSTVKGKKYYYRVRAYKVVGDDKIYGPWSDAKSYKLS